MGYDRQTYSLVTEDDGKEYLEASHGNIKGRHLERSHECWICGLGFRQSEMVRFRGVWYGRPCGDYKDIHYILKKERSEGLRAKARKEDVESQPGSTVTY